MSDALETQNYDAIRAKAEKSIMAARCRLLTLEPFYGHISMSIKWRESSLDWIPDPKARTFGLKIESNGDIHMLYSPEWAATKKVEELYGAIEHVINHLVRLHTLRRSHRHPEAWHIACDWVCNGTQREPRIGHKGDSGLILPDKNLHFIPEDLPSNETADYYYKFLTEQDKNNGGGGGNSKSKSNSQGGQGKGKGKGQGQGQGQSDGDGNGTDEDSENSRCSQDGTTVTYGKHSGNMVDNHDVWQQSEISEDEARQIVSERVRSAAEKSQGHIPGHLKEAIDQLNDPIVRWREQLSQFIGRAIGNRRKTYSRPDRRQGQFGTKGFSRHACVPVTVIVDSSGSIGKDELEQFFSEIDTIAHRATVHLVVWDAALQGNFKYRRGDWRKIEVSGGGGTDMAAPVTWAEENHVMGDVGIMLTDGWCNWPMPRGYPFLFCITSPKSSVPDPEWGTVIRLIKDQ